MVFLFTDAWGWVLLFSCQVVSDSLQPHGLQHARPPCPSIPPKVCSSSCPLHRWCHLTISSSDALFSFCPQLSQHQGLFQWVDYLYQITRILELQLQHQSFQWIFRLISFRIGWFDLLAVQRTLKSPLQHHNSKVSVLWHSALFMVQRSHLNMTPGKTKALTRQTFVSKVMSLFFNTLSRFVIAFLPRTKCSFSNLTSL